MSKHGSIVAIALIISLSALALSISESISTRHRLDALESQALLLGGDNKQTMDEAAKKEATKFAQSISELHNQLAKVNTDSLRARTNIQKAQKEAGKQSPEEAARRQEIEANRQLVANWSVNDVVVQLQSAGMKLETSEQKPRADASSSKSRPATRTQDNPFLDSKESQSWILSCKPADDNPFLLMRPQGDDPQRKAQALAICKDANFKPYSWGSFVFGFANDTQRDKVLAALPRIN